MKILKFIYIFLLYFLISSVNASSIENNNLSKSEQLIFERSPNSPVISSGYAGVPLFIMDPFVMKDSEGYHLFYSTLFCNSENGLYYSWDPLNPAKCTLDKQVSAIGYAFSSDKGLTWKFRKSPVFIPAKTGWDSGKVETANLILKDNQLILFYSAFGEIEGKFLENRFQIGVAFLDLKKSSIHDSLFNEKNLFTRNLRKSPLLSITTTKTSFFNNVQEPSVIYRNGLFELYFIGLAFSLPDKIPDSPGQKITDIGLGKAVYDENFNLISKSDEPILRGVNITEIHYFKNKYYLFSTAFGNGNLHKGEYLSYLTSDNGINWSQPKRVLKESQISIDNWSEVAPTVIEDNDLGAYVIFYTAFGIEKHPCSLISPNARWGFGISTTECVYGTLGRAVSPFLPKN